MAGSFLGGLPGWAGVTATRCARLAPSWAGWRGGPGLLPLVAHGWLLPGRAGGGGRGYCHSLRTAGSFLGGLAGGAVVTAIRCGLPGSFLAPWRVVPLLSPGGSVPAVSL